MITKNTTNAGGEYEFDRAIQGQVWKSIGGIKPGNNRYTITNLIPGTTYQVQVRAINNQGMSNPKTKIIKTEDGRNFHLPSVDSSMQVYDCPVPQIRRGNGNNSGYFFLFLNKNICCDPSLEPSRRDGSNGRPQHMLSWKKNKENYLVVTLFTPPYLEYCYVCR